VFYINTEGFLLAFKDIFLNIFIKANYLKALKVLGLIPTNARVVLDYLKVQLHTLLAVPLPKTLWQSKTLSNTHKFRS
ncbi:uncharacterized protein M421DRAFT_73676, partial [Didymella exigua CBS 183.55]